MRSENVSNTFQWLKEKGFMIMATKTTFQTLASEFYKAFERKTRPVAGSLRNEGEHFYSLRDGSPEWMTDAIHSAHDALDRMPDDWIYDQCHTIVCSLDDCASADDANAALHELADGCVDTYNSERYKWLASHIDNAALCDEAEQEFGDGTGDIADRIGRGQYVAATRIIGALICAIETQAGVVDHEIEVAS